MANTATIYELLDPSERRRSVRLSVGQETTVRTAGDPLTVILHDLSDTGAMIETATVLRPHMRVMVGLPGVGRFPATIVTNNGSRYGCRFELPLPLGATGAAFDNRHVVPLHPSYVRDPLTQVDTDASAKWPGGIRLAIFVGAPLAIWGAIFCAVRMLLW